MKQSKKLISLLLSLLMVLTMTAGMSFSSVAETEGVLTYVINGGVATITDCDTSARGELIIPDTLGGCPVTGIGDFAFSYCSSLTSITIPDSVTSIGRSAFNGCSSLTNFTVDDKNPYYSSDSYGVLFNKEKTNLLYYPAENSNTSYEIPDSVTSIGDWAFRDCTGLTSITIPDSVTGIGDYAFTNCSSLTSITIPDSVTSIGWHAFSICTSLTSITIPDSVTSIGWRAFSSCTSLTSITIPDSVTSTGDEAFYDCTSLTSITIPDSVTSIDDGAFYGCSSLTSITIPDSVTSIGESAFSGCSSLTSITIPDSVTSIGNYAIGRFFNEVTQEEEKIDGFIIYGTPGTAAETYANENGITFVAVEEESPIEKPTTTKPTTQVSAELIVKDTDSGIAVAEDEKIASIGAVDNKGLTAGEIKAKLGNESVAFVNKDGEALADDALVGTGCAIQVLGEDGAVLSSYTVLVPLDVNGDAAITAQDARIALRTAAKLQLLEGVFKQAADPDGNNAVTATDARKILRTSARLDPYPAV